MDGRRIIGGCGTVRILGTEMGIRHFWPYPRTAASITSKSFIVKKAFTYSGTAFNTLGAAFSKTNKALYQLSKFFDHGLIKFSDMP